MATRWAVANGNWSNTATWDGGTLPTSADDVFADGKTVTIDQSINVLSLRTTQRAGGTVGGAFQVTGNGYTLTLTGAQPVFGGVASASCLTLSHTSGTNTIIANLTGGGGGTNFFTTTISGAGGTTNITGTITGGSTSGCQGLRITNNATVNVTGDVTGGSNTNTHGILATVTCTLNVTGNVSSGTSSGSGISNTGSSGFILSVTGNVTNGAGTAASISSTEISATVSIIGTITASNSAMAVAMTLIQSAQVLTVSGNMVDSASYSAVWASRLRILSTAVMSWTLKDQSGNNKILYTAGVALGNPATNNVRSGTVYGASNELTGTLIVPLPSNVVSGVPTDNTVGTYTTTPALIATEIFTKLLSNSDFNTSGSFGKLIKDNLDAQVSTRLASSSYTAPDNTSITAIKAKTDNLPTNPASVQSVGAIVASYNV